MAKPHEMAIPRTTLCALGLRTRYLSGFAIV
jgi:hypothetical protein